MSATRVQTPNTFGARAPAGSSQTYQSAGAVLRRTCHACAASKLKCSSHKPTCARCAKRDEPCTYVVAKRGGRKKNRSNVATNDDSKAVPPAPPNNQADKHVGPVSPANWFPSSSFGSDSGPLPSLERPQQRERLEVCPSGYNAPTFAGSLHRSLFPMMDPTRDLSDLFTSPPFDMGLGDVGFFDITDFLPSAFDGHSSGSTDSFLDAFPAAAFEEATSESSAVSMIDSASNYSTIDPNSIQNSQQSPCPSSSSPCTCLVQVLGFMKQLSTPLVTSLRSSSTRHESSKAEALQVIQTVLAQNDAVLPAAVRIVNCKCLNKDGYLLIVVSLLILKVLGWYAVVIRNMSMLESSPIASDSRQPPPGQDQQQQLQQLYSKPAVVIDYSLDGKESARMTAQLVLNELHRVRRLVDQISAKLKTHATRNSTTKPVGGADIEPDRLSPESGMALSLSAVMYQQIDTELRKHLLSLSRDTIDQLKRL